MFYSLGVPGVLGVLAVLGAPGAPGTAGAPSVRAVRVPRLEVGTQPETKGRARPIRLICGFGVVGMLGGGGGLAHR